MPPIDCLDAFVAEDSGADDEAIVAAKTSQGRMPLVGADRARIEWLPPLAEAMARQAGKTIKLVHFEKRRELEIISKKG